MIRRVRRRDIQNTEINMRLMAIAVAGAFLAVGISPVLAQSDSTPRTTATPPAVSTSNSESKTTAAPVPGKNSFTESEARSRLESFGYTNVTALHQDEQSIWRGTATKGGQEVQVGLDYQGNIVTR
jgi:putative membrane protein